MKLQTIIFSLFFIFFICFSSFSKDLNKNINYEKYYKEIPVYPNSQVYDLEKTIGTKMKLHLTSSKFEDVSMFYVSEFEKKGWIVEFPNSDELKIWMDALYKSKTRNPNIMIHLKKINTSIYCNLSIGVVKNKKTTQDLTAITIYITSTML